MDDEKRPSASSEIAFKYAWDWFSYHAAQRLTTFRFFLIIIGVVVVGYFKCLEQGWRGLGFLTGLFGVLISIAFWLLEIRNEELVNCGRHALDKLEESVGLTIRKDDKDRAYLEESLDPVSRLIPKSWRHKGVKHRSWLRLIHLVGGIASALAAIYALRGFRW